MRTLVLSQPSWCKGKQFYYQGSGTAWFHWRLYCRTAYGSTSDAAPSWMLIQSEGRDRRTSEAKIRGTAHHQPRSEALTPTLGKHTVPERSWSLQLPGWRPIVNAVTTQLSLWFDSHIHTWLLEKTIALTVQGFVNKMMSLLFNTLSRFVIAFLPSGKCCVSCRYRAKWYSYRSVQFSSVAQSCLTLQPHEPQHARPPCPSPTPGVHPNPCPLSQWCHPTISSFVTPFSFCPQSFPASGSFQMSQLFASGSQSTGVSASTSVLPMNAKDWSPLGWTGWISLQSKGLSKSLLQHHSSKASILQCSAFFIVQLSHPYMTPGKTIVLTRQPFIDKVMSLLFNMLSRLVITFLPRSKCLLISWLQSPSAVIMEPDAIILVFSYTHILLYIYFQILFHYRLLYGI